MSDHLHIIVAGVATLSPTDPALAPSIRLAERTGAALHLVHVHAEAEDGHDWRFARGGPGLGPQAQLLSNLLALSASENIRAVALPGKPAEVLPQYAAEAGADLLVLGTARLAGAAGAVLGTTAPRVLRASTVPVLVLHGPDPWLAPRRVLVPTDLSEHSAGVLPVAARLAAALAAPAAPEFWPVFVEVPDLEAEGAEVAASRRSYAESELAGFLSGIPALDGVPALVRAGYPSAEICAAAHEWGADLIVLGTHGRRGIPRLFLGSVAERVLRHAPCNALVVPPLAVARAAEPLPDGAASWRLAPSEALWESSGRRPETGRAAASTG
jgi:nucleotide-binding universal stress UspA family protein